MNDQRRNSLYGQTYGCQNNGQQQRRKLSVAGLDLATNQFQAQQLRQQLMFDDNKYPAEENGAVGDHH